MSQYAQQAQCEQIAESKTIVIVEDDIALGFMLTMTFTQETPYRSILAPTGKQALNIFQTITPDLVLLDYRLPDITGLEIFDYLRSQAKFAQLPVLMMSTDLPVLEVDKRRVQQKLYGIAKPFDLDELLDTVDRLLFTVDSNP